MSDVSSETQSKRASMNPERYDRAKQRAKSLKSPWRNGPAVKSRNAHDAYAKSVAGDVHGLRSNK
jgi:hypothetical protein